MRARASSWVARPKRPVSRAQAEMERVAGRDEDRRSGEATLAARSVVREDGRVSTTDATRLAVLIDSDNTTASLTTELLEDDGWSNLGEVGSYLVKSHAAFDPRDYGHTKLGELVRKESYVEVKDVSGPAGSQLLVRLKPAARTAARGR